MHLGGPCSTVGSSGVSTFVHGGFGAGKAPSVALAVSSDDAAAAVHISTSHVQLSASDPVSHDLSACGVSTVADSNTTASIVHNTWSM